MHRLPFRTLLVNSNGGAGRWLRGGRGCGVEAMLAYALVLYSESEDLLAWNLLYFSTIFEVLSIGMLYYERIMSWWSQRSE